MSCPAAPLRLRGAPTQGGLVIPYISVRHRDGRARFSSNDPRRHHRCLVEARCSVCGQPLADPGHRPACPAPAPGDKYALLVRPSDLLRGYSSEPGLHGECAAYARRACPMLNGSRTHYRRNLDLEADRCADPACDCWLWANATDIQARAGAPASPFYQLWRPMQDYRLHCDVTDRVRGVQIDYTPTDKIRLVTPGNPDPVEVARTLLLGLPWHPHIPSSATP